MSHPNRYGAGGPRALIAGLLALLVIVAFLLLLAASHALAAATLCVKPGGGGGCSSTIAAAVAAAQPGDTIQVAAGVYTENVVLTESVTLEGGWNSDFTSRDPALYISTIRPADPAVAVVTIQGQIANPAAVAPTLDGFTITGARSTNHGGGLRMIDSSALVRNNVITDNVAYLLGGGIWAQRGAPRLENNRIANNRISNSSPWGQGGGIELEGTQASLVGNVIAGNTISATTGYGGGMDIAGGGPVMLTGNSVLSNVAALGDGYGGGVSVEAVTATMSDNLVQGNSASVSGAVGYGGGVYITRSLAFTLTHNTFLRNKVYAENSGTYPSFGGGVYVGRSQGLLSGNTFIDNQAGWYGILDETGYGGGLAAAASTVAVQGDQFAGNSVRFGDGCGVYAQASSLTLDAVRVQNNPCAGLFLSNTPYTLTNAFVTGNANGLRVSTSSPGRVVNDTFVANGELGILSASALTLTNSVLVSHTTGVSLTGAPPISATYNDFYANVTPVRGFSLDPTNIAINPQFAVDYHLSASSPLLDAGKRLGWLPPHDIDGESRFMAGPSGLYKVDIGADERTGPAQRLIDPRAGTGLAIIGPGGYAPTPNGFNDWIGSSVLGSDITGDGLPDLVVSAHDWAEDPDNPPFTTGRVFGLFNLGTRLSGTIDLLTHTADLTLVSKLPLQHIGAALAGGDLNGDGRSDLLVGSSQDDNAGNGTVTPTVFVFWGGPGLAGSRTLSATAPADFALRAPGQDFYAFAAKDALASADLNGGGVDDLVVADALANDGATPGTGAVFVIFGRSTLTGVQSLATTPADYTVYGPAANAGLGRLAVGRLNADVATDLVARSDMTAYVLFGPFAAGVRHLGTTPADVTITGLQAGSVAVADFTGDGQEDIILTSGGSVYVVPGPFSGGQSFDVASRAVLRLTGRPVQLLAVGNVTGDARPDLLLSPLAPDPVYVVSAGQGITGTVPIADAAAWVVQAYPPNYLFSDLGVGDLDHDGRPDLFVGMPHNVPSHPPKYDDAGVVYVVYGDGAAGPPPAPGWRVFLPIVFR